jgi:hypothetical protein
MAWCSVKAQGQLYLHLCIYDTWQISYCIVRKYVFLYFVKYLAQRKMFQIKFVELNDIYMYICYVTIS